MVISMKTLQPLIAGHSLTPPFGPISDQPVNPIRPPASNPPTPHSMAPAMPSSPPTSNADLPSIQATPSRKEKSFKRATNGGMPSIGTMPRTAFESLYSRPMPTSSPAPLPSFKHWIQTSPASMPPTKPKTPSLVPFPPPPRANASSPRSRPSMGAEDFPALKILPCNVATQAATQAALRLRGISPPNLSWTMTALPKSSPPAPSILNPTRLLRGIITTSQSSPALSMPTRARRSVSGFAQHPRKPPTTNRLTTSASISGLPTLQPDISQLIGTIPRIKFGPAPDSGETVSTTGRSTMAVSIASSEVATGAPSTRSTPPYGAMAKTSRFQSAPVVMPGPSPPRLAPASSSAPDQDSIGVAHSSSTMAWDGTLASSSGFVEMAAPSLKTFPKEEPTRSRQEEPPHPSPQMPASISPPLTFLPVVATNFLSPSSTRQTTP